jgi:hypothetical protein
MRHKWQWSSFFKLPLPQAIGWAAYGLAGRYDAGIINDGDANQVVRGVKISGRGVVPRLDELIGRLKVWG